MNWKKECLKTFKLYAITDLKEEDPQILDKISEALRGGVGVIQLRSKALSDKVLLELGRKVRQITQKYKKLFIINDRVDLMLAVDADGVHLGQDDLPIKEARHIVGNQRRIIGLSTHSLDQALQAEHEGADYIGFGPIFETPTKPTYKPVGLHPIGQVVKHVKIPVVCIGGIDETNVEKVIEAGASRVAVVRAIFARSNTYEAARNLKGLLSACHSREGPSTSSGW